MPAKVVIDRNQGLICESKVSTLALKLARELCFGEDVMVRCTVIGDRELPALPQHELDLLKSQILTLLFPAYWTAPMNLSLYGVNVQHPLGKVVKGFVPTLSNSNILPIILNHIVTQCTFT